MIPILRALLAQTGLPPNASLAIPALVFDGVAASMRHTGGLGGVSDGTSWSGVWIGKVNSDDSAMSFRSIRNGTGVVFSLRRTATNTIEFKGFQADASTAVFSCVTTATVKAADGLVAIFYGCRGTHAALAVVKSTGAAVGTNTPGTAGDIDFTADDYLGQDGASGEWLDADQSLHWGHNIWMDPHDREWRDQFYDRATDLLRNPGATGANPLGGVTQPLMCHKGAAASATANAGSGGDADNPGVFTDGVSPGSYSAALVNGFDVLLAAAGWWSADQSENTVATGFSQLTDRTANGNDFVQATAANQPLRLDTSGVISAEYDGTDSGGDDIMNIAAPDAALANHSNAGGTRIWVARPDGRGGGNFGRIWSMGASFDGDWTRASSPFTHVGLFLNGDTTGTDLQASTVNDPFANGTKILAEFRYDESSNDPANELVVTLNGTSFPVGGGELIAPTPTGTPVDHSASVMNLGNNSNGNRCFDGGIYELAFWDTLRSDAEMTRLRTHQARKYGVTLP